MINMNLEIQSKAYDFLRTNPDLKNVIYLTLSGSHGYGTNNKNSDIDLRGCLIEDKKYLFGLETFEQFEELETDTVIYGLKKFVKLCAAANPNALELLGTDEASIVIITEVGKKLRDHGDLFLSKLVINSFGNYATAQLRRLQNALCHDVYKKNEQEKHLENKLRAQLDHFSRSYTEFDHGAIEFHIDEKTQELNFDITLKNYPVRDFVGIYSEMNNTVKSYHKLNHRNKKKDEPHLYKHAMHLIRLLITGTDILSGKGIITNRKEEHDLLMNLRNGQYTFEEIFKLTDEFQAKFQHAAENTQLPDRPNKAKIEDLLMELYQG